MKLEDAKKKGATALFDEKYEDMVRVVTLYDSMELCGGTHVKNTGDINFFAIKSFESKGANTYRIEAATSTNITRELFDAIKSYNDEMIKLLNKSKRIINEALEEGIKLSFNINIDNSTPTSYKDILFNREEVNHVREEVKNLEKEYNRRKEEKVLENINIFDKYIEKNDNIEYVITRVDNYELATLKQIVDNLTEKLNNGFVFIANVVNNNVNFIAKCNKGVGDKINCGNIVKDASIKSNGNGGGSPIFAQGGGTNISKLDEILEEIKEVVNKIN
jgi:alanyl-tRNA synthetase